MRGKGEKEGRGGEGEENLQNSGSDFAKFIHWIKELSNTSALSGTRSKRGSNVIK